MKGMLAAFANGRAKVPMLPVTAGEAETRRQIMIYSVVMAACSALPVLLGCSGIVYASLAAVGGAVFLWMAADILRKPGNTRVAMRLFAFSIFYLFALFAAVIVEAVAGVVPLVTP
jgi:protoheme IX farnesyltransferase